MFTYYKNDSIRKLVIAFGSLFNNIHIMQKTSTGEDRDIMVPITYSPKEKFIKRLILPSSISESTRVEINIPQIGFEITNITYDPTRHLNKVHKKLIGSTGNTDLQSYMEVPYNFTFGLYAYSRNIDENLQMMEQILPYFSPEFVITINVNNNTYKKIDIPITLMQTVLTQEYEGDFNSRRAIISSYIFNAKSYVYGKTETIFNITNYLATATTNPGGITFGITGGFLE
jgi:hypothetical protein